MPKGVPKNRRIFKVRNDSLDVPTDLEAAHVPNEPFADAMYADALRRHQFYNQPQFLKSAVTRCMGLLSPAKTTLVTPCRGNAQGVYCTHNVYVNATSDLTQVGTQHVLLFVLN